MSLSTLILEGKGLDLVGNNVTLRENTIHTSSENAICLKTLDNLEISDNKFSKSNPLDLTFPELGVRSITLRGTDLKRPKKGFIDTKVLGTLLIDNCLMELGNEEAFNVDVQHLVLSNSKVVSMNTGSFKANAVRTRVEIHDNIFEHCQEKVFYEINLSKNSTMIMRRNTFSKFEDGFFKLDKFMERNLDDFNIEISRVDLLKKCHCSLAHEVITEDSIGNITSLTSRISPEELEDSHADHTEGHLDFEHRLQGAIR